VIKNQLEKRRKGNKTLSPKKQKGAGFFFDKKAIEEKEPKIKVLEHGSMFQAIMTRN
jgi:hypothetical protein